MKRGEVWHIDLNPFKGSEQGGQRPCLIVQNDEGNEHSNTVTVVTITTKDKGYKKTHVFTNELKELSIIQCEHLKTLDKTRFKKYRCTLSEETMKEVDKKIKLHLNIT